MRHVWPLVGMVMLTVLLMADFIFDALNVLRSLIPATRLLTSFTYAFAGLPGPKPARAMVRFGADIPGVLVAIEAIALA